MRVLVQRVTEAKVTVEGEVVGAIGRGLLLLVGVTHADTPALAARLAARVAGLRCFDDAEGKPNLGLPDVGGAVLAVSQFTLYADAAKGRRPSYAAAAPGPAAEPVYEAFVAALRAAGVPVSTGRFGAMMAVSLVNDGPYTLWLESP